MARFNQPRQDRRGEAFDRRYGRYEGAFARRFALRHYEPERPPRWVSRAMWDYEMWSDPDEFAYYDQDYSRRYWPGGSRWYGRDY